jgi:hypothetical protein
MTAPSKETANAPPGTSASGTTPSLEVHRAGCPWLVPTTVRPSPEISMTDPPKSPSPRKENSALAAVARDRRTMTTNGVRPQQRIGIPLEKLAMRGSSPEPSLGTYDGSSCADLRLDIRGSQHGSHVRTTACGARAAHASRVPREPAVRGTPTLAANALERSSVQLERDRSVQSTMAQDGRDGDQSERRKASSAS